MPHLLLAALLSPLLAAGVARAPAPGSAGPAGPCRGLTDLEKLGRHLFFDANLSEPRGQSCATCHAAETGFTGESSGINAATAVYPGAVATRFGNRKPSSAAYAAQAPVLRLDPEEKSFVGGNFWDGRATGEKLGNPAADQAQGPFLNPVEQNLPSAAALVERVCAASYASLFRKVFGPGACADAGAAYDRIAKAIAAYEESPEVSAFSSRFDAFAAGSATLSARELRGMRLFHGKGKCADCHPPPLFTDYTYDNLGFPPNPANPFYAQAAENPAGEAWVDPGLAGFLATRPEWASLAAENRGKHRVPTLRNVDKRPSKGFVKAYGHNGAFTSLEAIVHFYNTRDTLPRCPPDGAGAGTSCWPAPEIAENVNTEELGDLRLTAAEEADLVAFLRTLSDRGPGRRRGCAMP
jgi:cytochrome c peroxidase